jgi:hypothetical protein
MKTMLALTLLGKDATSMTRLVKDATVSDIFHKKRHCQGKNVTRSDVFVQRQ